MKKSSFDPIFELDFIGKFIFSQVSRMETALKIENTFFLPDKNSTSSMIDDFAVQTV